MEVFQFAHNLHFHATWCMCLNFTLMSRTLIELCTTSLAPVLPLNKQTSHTLIKLGSTALMAVLHLNKHHIQ